MTDSFFYNSAVWRSIGFTPQNSYAVNQLFHKKLLNVPRINNSRRMVRELGDHGHLVAGRNETASHFIGSDLGRANFGVKVLG